MRGPASAETFGQGTRAEVAWLDWPAMPAVADDAPATAGRLDFTRIRPHAPGVLLALLIVLIALQRGGYFAESWGLPTAACAWAVILAALLGDRRRMRRLEFTQLGAFAVLAVLALLSAAWQPGGLGTSLPQAQLLALYLAALSAVYMLFRRATPLLVPVWAALSLVSVLALLTRLFPSGAGTDTLTGNRLSEPLGYWNSLGLWAAMAVALAIVLAARSRSMVLRVAAAASCVPAAATLYFTYSRGAWIAFAAGLAVAIALDPRRLDLITWTLAMLAWPALGVLLASGSPGLTSEAAPLDQARERRPSARGLPARIDHRRGVYRLWRVARRASLAGTTRCPQRRCGCAHHHGCPLLRRNRRSVRRSLVHRTRCSPPLQRAAAPGLGRSQRATLHNLREWSHLPLAGCVARRAAPSLRGSGAGSYSAEWFRERTVASDATNAHQLYLETLAELGPLGLGLLLAALGTPLAAAWRARRHPLASGATAAYVAFLVHVAADWDWQLAAVGLAALCCGAALVVMARASPSRAAGVRARTALSACGVLLAGFAVWSLYGSAPLGQARDAIDDGRWAAAELHANDAVGRIGGFSSPSWRLLGEAQTALGKTAAARASLRRAVARDPSSWQAWYDLAEVTQGSERRVAIERAVSLNPLGHEPRALAQGAGITPSSP